MKLLARLDGLTRGLPPAYWLLWVGTLMVSLFGVGSFLAQVTGGELTDRLGRPPVMLLSLFLTPPVMVAPVAMAALGRRRGTVGAPLDFPPRRE